MMEAMIQEEGKKEEDMVPEIAIMMNTPPPEHQVKEKEIHCKEKRDQEIIPTRCKVK